MKIGIIGRGTVGDTLYRGLEKYHEMSFFDIKYENTTIQDILDTDCCFICVPTALNDDQIFDISHLQNILKNLQELCYQGIICIKSTILPGTTDYFIELYENKNICFVPEFLRERQPLVDFIYHNPLCIVGTFSNSIFDMMKIIHKEICQEYKMVSPTEAEVTKLMQNSFNTLKIIYANGMYEVCQHLGIDYSNVLKNLLSRGEIEEKYMKCNTSLRGPSGSCLVKDTVAFSNYINQLSLNKKPEIFNCLVHDIKLYPPTIIQQKKFFIPHYTPPRKDILISNPFYLTKHLYNHKQIYTIVIYYRA